MSASSNRGEKRDRGGNKSRDGDNGEKKQKVAAPSVLCGVTILDKHPIPASASLEDYWQFLITVSNLRFIADANFTAQTYLPPQGSVDVTRTRDGAIIDFSLDGIKISGRFLAKIRYATAARSTGICAYGPGDIACVPELFIDADNSISTYGGHFPASDSMNEPQKAMVKTAGAVIALASPDRYLENASCKSIKSILEMGKEKKVEEALWLPRAMALITALVDDKATWDPNEKPEVKTPACVHRLLAVLAPLVTASLTMERKLEILLGLGKKQAAEFLASMAFRIPLPMNTLAGLLPCEPKMAYVRTELKDLRETDRILVGAAPTSAGQILVWLTHPDVAAVVKVDVVHMFKGKAGNKKKAMPPGTKPRLFKTESAQLHVSLIKKFAGEKEAKTKADAADKGSTGFTM